MWFILPGKHKIKLEVYRWNFKLVKWSKFDDKVLKEIYRINLIYFLNTRVFSMNKALCKVDYTKSIIIASTLKCNCVECKEIKVLWITLTEPGKADIGHDERKGGAEPGPVCHQILLFSFRLCKIGNLIPWTVFSRSSISWLSIGIHKMKDRREETIYCLSQP